MKSVINLDALLAPIAGENPAGEDLRYSQVYEDIKEARRADDPIEQGEWKTDLKSADWEKVILLATDALSAKTKDLQIATWLTEGLITTEGFEGLAVGLALLSGLLDQYWDGLYPQIEDGDLEFRAASLEFLNEKLWSAMKQIPVTEGRGSPGYSWLRWKESRDVGYESDLRNKYGDTDETRKAKREESIADGKITAEQFDAAVTASSKAFYKSLNEQVEKVLEEFKRLDATVDEKFGSEAPRLAEFREALDECKQLVGRIWKEKGGEQLPGGGETKAKKGAANQPAKEEGMRGPAAALEGRSLVSRIPGREAEMLDTASLETALWEEAVQLLETAGMKRALESLLEASFGAPSVRQKNRYRLLIAKLCLKAERPDLARPIVEELAALIEELHLERWESPVWIAEVLEAYYRCLTSGEASDDDLAKARTLFQRLCTTDVTKAITYRQ